MHKQPEVRAHTRQKMIDAFWALCKEKNFNQISVGELSRLAGYNRSTFYEYFTDMPDLIAQVEDELLENIRQGLAKSSYQIMQNDKDGIPDFFHMLFQMLNEPTYCLLGPHGDPAFFSRVKEAAMPAFSVFFSQPENSTYFDYLFSYSYSAIIGYLQCWHEKGKDLSEEEFFRLGYDLLSKGVLGILGSTGETQI